MLVRGCLWNKGLVRGCLVNKKLAREDKLSWMSLVVLLFVLLLVDSAKRYRLVCWGIIIPHSGRYVWSGLCGLSGMTTRIICLVGSDQGLGNIWLVGSHQDP